MLSTVWVLQGKGTTALLHLQTPRFLFHKQKAAVTQPLSLYEGVGFHIILGFHLIWKKYWFSKLRCSLSLTSAHLFWKTKCSPMRHQCVGPRWSSLMELPTWPPNPYVSKSSSIPDFCGFHFFNLLNKAFSVYIILES